LVLALGACSSSPTAQSPKSSAFSEARDLVNDQAREIEPEFLIPCEWVVMPVIGPEENVLPPKELIRVIDLNAQIYKKCYIIHNSFVKQYSNEKN